MAQDSKLNLIPREAYRFWPNQSITKRHSGRFFQRMIFKRQEFSDEEEEALAKLGAVIDEDPILSVRIAKRAEKPDILRMIYAAEWDIPSAVDRLRAYIDWLDSYLSPIRLSGPSAFLPVLSSGGCYTFGRDCFYRPLVILTPSILVRFPLDIVLKSTTFLLDFIEAHLMLPGQIENWVLLIDMEQSQVCAHKSILEMKTLLDPFLTAYACRLAAGFIWRINRSLWERTTAILSPETSGKFTIVTEQGGWKDLHKIVNKTQLESKFGGLAGQKAVFWPVEEVNRAVYSTDTVVALSDYSSFQEYFPERSLSMGDTSHISFSDEESPRQVTSFVVSPWPSQELAETEEGPTVTRPVRVNRLSVDLSRSCSVIRDRRRPIINVDNTEAEGLGCYCLTRKSAASDCEIF